MPERAKSSALDQIPSETAYPHGDQFIVCFKYDVTCHLDGPMKGQRMQMEEAGLYTVKDGKIVREQFFYAMGG